MRGQLQHRTPAQLLWIIAASNALVAAAFGVMAWNHSKGLLLWCSFAALLLSIIGSLFAEQSLGDGIKSEQWPDSLLDAPRKLTLLIAVLFIGALACMVTIGPHKSGGIWMFLWPIITLARVRNYLRPKPISNSFSR